MKLRYFLSLKYNPASEIMDYLEVNQGQEKQIAELVVVLLLISCFPWHCGLLNWNHNFRGLPAKGKASNESTKQKENKREENSLVKIW